MNPIREVTTFSLEDARKRVTVVTEEIFNLFLERQRLMRKIAEAKMESGGKSLPIYLPQREQDLRAHFRNLASEKGADSNMADMLVSMLMSAAKFEQMDILQRQTILDVERPSEDDLKRNLLTLTECIAADYDNYGVGKFGRDIECERERFLLEKLSGHFHGGTIVNLGCSNGARVTSVVENAFDRIIGYDISDPMICAAKKKYPEHEFYVHDLDTGIPLPDSSVNLVVANSGAASEICNGNLFLEVGRVLAPGGCAFLSFYNRDSLITKWWTPWSNTFNIVINAFNNTIMVPIIERNGSVQAYWINAKIVSASDLLGWTSLAGLEVISLESSSPLWDDKPPEFFKHEEAVRSAFEYEGAHAQIAPYIGQYLRVIVKK